VEVKPGAVASLLWNFFYKYPYNYVYFQKKIKNMLVLPPLEENFNLPSPYSKSGSTPEQKNRQ
jgi:hypothetical protein